MPDSVTLHPAVPPHRPASHPEADRGSSTTASPPNDHVAPYSATASAGSSSYQPPRSPPFLPSFPSFPSSITKAPPSVCGSRTATMTATSPPTTMGRGIGSIDGSGTRSSGATTANTSLYAHLPSRDSQLHVAEARTALLASMSNMIDSELQSRASLLHSNAAALSRQERDVAKATEALRKENDKLAKVAKDTGRKIKELGNVQNWAEVLERDFLVLEETVRLVRDSSPECDSSCSECSSGSWSHSEDEPDGERSNNAVSERREEDSMAAQVAVRKEKGKGVDRPAANGSGTIVSLDEAVLESLAEAMATDIYIGSRTTGRSAPQVS